MFRSSIRLYTSIVGVCIATSVYSQETTNTGSPPPQSPPIIMEALTSNRGVHYQAIINKKFQSIRQLGFFSVTNGVASWDKEPTPDIMTQAHLTCTLVKGLDVTSGMQYTPLYGFRPVAGLIYSYASPGLLIVLNPKIDLKKDVATEAMAMCEYKPNISEEWRLYNRIQGLYGFVPKDGVHNRSYIMLRAGLNYKEFSFGAGANFDWYGPVKYNQNSVGAFLNVLIF